MRQPVPHAYLLIGATLAAAVTGPKLVRLLAPNRVPPPDLRFAALSAAAVVAAVALSERRTRRTLELARRLERARIAEPPVAPPEVSVVRMPRRVHAVRP